MSKIPIKPKPFSLALFQDATGTIIALVDEYGETGHKFRIHFACVLKDEVWVVWKLCNFISPSCSIELEHFDEFPYRKLMGTIPNGKFFNASEGLYYSVPPITPIHFNTFEAITRFVCPENKEPGDKIHVRQEKSGTYISRVPRSFP